MSPGDPDRASVSGTISSPEEGVMVHSGREEAGFPELRTGSSLAQRALRNLENSSGNSCCPGQAGLRQTHLMWLRRWYVAHSDVNSDVLVLFIHLSRGE